GVGLRRGGAPGGGGGGLGRVVPPGPRRAAGAGLRGVVPPGPRRAAARTVAGRCRAKDRSCGRRAPTVRPNGPRAADRRPGAPSPTPGTVSSRARNGAAGGTGALGGVSAGCWV